MKMSTYAYLTGAAIGHAALTGLGGAASAAPLTPLQLTAEQNGNVVQVANKWERDRNRRMTKNWDRERHGRRCNNRIGGCRHFYRGYYYETPWWTIPLIVGGGFGADRYVDDYDFEDNVYYGGGSAHVRWCLNRYKSYNPRTNTWVAYSGRVRQCISPYS